MDNIAEGFDGGSDPEFIRFFGYAQRFCFEVKSELYRAKDRNLITPDPFNQFTNSPTKLAPKPVDSLNT